MSNPAAVEEQLATLGRLLDDNRILLAQADREFVKAKHDFDIAFAKAILSARESLEAEGRKSSNEQERKAWATRVTADKKFAAECAEAAVRAIREEQRTLAIRVEIGRSLRASFRSEWAAS